MLFKNFKVQYLRLYICRQYKESTETKAYKADGAQLFCNSEI